MDSTSPRVEIVPLTRAHLKNIYGQESPEDQAQNDLRIKAGMGFAAVIEGRIIGAGGIAVAWKGVGVAWTVLTDEIKERHKKSLHKAVKRLFPIIVKIFALERVQADALAESETNCAWLKHLGFKFEGTMEKYCDRKTYLRFAWVHPDPVEGMRA